MVRIRKEINVIVIALHVPLHSYGSTTSPIRNGTGVIEYNRYRICVNTNRFLLWTLGNAFQAVINNQENTQISVGHRVLIHSVNMS